MVVLFVLVLEEAVVVAVAAKEIKEKIGEPLVVEVVVEQVVHQEAEDKEELLVLVVVMVVEDLKPLVAVAVAVEITLTKHLVNLVDLVDRHKEVQVEHKVEVVQMVLP